MEFREGTTEAGIERRSGGIVRVVLLTILAVALLALVLSGLALAATPASLRNPEFAHYHARLTLVNDGRRVDFSRPAFQADYDKDSCSAQLTREPFHFHDGLDQFLHVHWAGMTGGQLLKYYGWNEVGGLPGALGVKTGGSGGPRLIPVRGGLPERPTDSKLYIFTGSKDNFRERQASDFLGGRIDAFLDGSASASWLDNLIPTAQAHSHPEKSGPSHEEKARLNNFKGNIVIFAQKEKPTDEQVRAALEKLVPLPESTCAG